MNWLQIARRIRKECDLAGNDTTPATIAGQTGEMASVVNWMADSWRTIQQAKLWGWMWEQASLTLAADASTITATVSARRYDKESMLNGSDQLTYIPWQEFRGSYPPSTITTGTPYEWTVRPDRSLAFNAKPADDLSLTVERYKEAQEIGADTDEPDMPADLHMAIVWGAVMLYAGFDEAGGLYQHAKSEYKRLLGSMALDELPDFDLGAPLVG